MSPLQHVALEIKRDDLEVCLAFYALVGFEEVPVPDERLVESSRFLQGGATQIHLLLVDEPVIPPQAHAAILLDDYEATLVKLRGAGYDPKDRARYWGSPRAKVTDPAGHVVELMEFAP